MHACAWSYMSDVELTMRFELAHSVPKLFKFLHFVTSLLIAYDGPRGPSQATRLSKHKKLSHAQSHSLQMVYITNEIPRIKCGWSVIW